MSNKLEGFVKDNKKEFEVKGPSNELWAKIEAELDKKQEPKKSIKLYQWMSIAAMLIVSLGIYFTYNYKLVNNDEIEIAQVSPEFGQKEVRFVNQIEEKKDSLVLYATENPELYQQFTADLKNLDAEYEKLKLELQKTPNQLFVVKAMVKNREMQLQVLKQQLTIINQVNQYKKESSI
jgi:paraquat-inducible protein B